MKLIEPKPFYFDNGPKAVVLMHSLSGTPNDMRLLGRFLQRNEYSVYAPMFKGHGTYEPLDIIEQGDPTVWWQQAIDAVDYLMKQGKTEFYFFGLSLGAIFATKAIEELPEVSAGGTFGSPLFNTSYAMVRKEFLIYAKKVYQISETDETVMNEKMSAIDDKLDNFMDKIISETHNVENNLNKITGPYFVGQGTSDVMVDPDGANKVKQRLSNVDLHWYDAGHVLTVNKAHKDVQNDVLNFLEKIEETNA
ncbi:alpha/beta hydrolase [Companilactobacillus furfuricola]|uniref:alpha/beta hydrolase n=1 Tax=Companilactobacillus furfuricola TaxID=1462575 RepID=UPI000F789C72|nr:alpha/beta hydrolase [Companilactobacillus furfuricola]